MTDLLTDDQKIAQLTPVQITALEELQVSLMREYDTDKLRQLVLSAELARMLESNVCRGLAGGDW